MTAIDLSSWGAPEAAEAVVSAFVAERLAEREHVVVHLSGAHAYGFPSPDSDYDLKAIFVAPTEQLLGFSPPKPAVDRLETIGGFELDYTANELAPVLAGIASGNGNYLERVLGASKLVGSALLEELAPIARRSLSRRVRGHYRGFATQQRRALEEKPTVKRLLYVLRTALTGIHALRAGEIDPHVTTLAAHYRVEGVPALIEQKTRGERTALDPAEARDWSGRIEALLARIDEEHDRSPLPEEAPNRAELESFLLAVRRR